MARTPWTCPDCGRSFAQRVSEHACQLYTLGRHLDGKPDEVAAIVEKLVAAGQGLGASVEVLKTMIVMRTTKNFAGITVQRRGVRLSLLVGSAPDSPRVKSGPGYGSRVEVTVWLESADEVDAEVLDWLAEAYELALQAC